LGVGSTPGYAATGISTYELFEVQRAAANYRRWTGFHTRFHCSGKTPTEAQLGFAEVFTNACLLKAPLLITPHVFAQEAKAQPKLTLISNVNIFDGVNDKLHRHQRVVHPRQRFLNAEAQLTRQAGTVHCPGRQCFPIRWASACRT
jgi:hypothetical protein